jgi:hypothetical protein
MEYIVIVTLLVVIIYQGGFIWAQKKHFEKTEKDLLNRILARNYETYVQGEKILEPPRPLTPEEIYERDMERGVTPV